MDEYIVMRQGAEDEASECVAGGFTTDADAVAHVEEQDDFERAHYEVYGRVWSTVPPWVRERLRKPVGVS
jgi:hypothetical protein